jgi:hypothetical protein
MGVFLGNVHGFSKQQQGISSYHAFDQEQKSQEQQSSMAIHSLNIVHHKSISHFHQNTQTNKIRAKTHMSIKL